jgi:hypothetical protein
MRLLESLHTSSSQESHKSRSILVRAHCEIHETRWTRDLSCDEAVLKLNIASLPRTTKLRYILSNINRFLLHTLSFKYNV